MRYAEHPVPAALRRHAECVWTLTSDGEAPPREAGTVLPDGCVEVVLSFGGPVGRRGDRRAFERFVVGPLDRPIRVRYRREVDLVVARLRPAAASSFIDVPLATLRGRIANLGTAAPNLDAEIRRAFLDRPSGQARVEALARALLHALAGARPIDPLVESAVAAVARAEGRVAVAEIAATVGLSGRTLQRRFQDVVGLTPSALARVLRFRRVWEAAPTVERNGWTVLAIDAGYADQPHMIRDFRAFAGASPSRVARSPKLRAERRAARR